MINSYYKKLDLYVDINELLEYFSIVETKYIHKYWTVNKFLDQISEKKLKTFKEYPNQDLYGGWAIDSNLEDLDAVCPPLNESISNLPKLEIYRSTELSFGIIEKLKNKIPFAYKWAIISQPTNGRVFKHDDRGEYVTHIIIQSSSECVFRFYKNDNEFLDFSLPVDGNLYTLNTELKHETWNNGTIRHSLIFVIKKEDFPKLEALSGKI